MLKFILHEDCIDEINEKWDHTERFYETREEAHKQIGWLIRSKADDLRASGMIVFIENADAGIIYAHNGRYKSITIRYIIEITLDS